MKTIQRTSSHQKTDSHAVYRLRITVPGSKPLIWRRLQVAAGMTLNELHQVLQTVMGWERRYPYQFDDGLFWYGQDFADESGEFVPGGEDDTKVQLCAVAVERGAKFDYNYRLDEIMLEGIWSLRIQVEEILPADEKLRVPLCLGGERASPPEDALGIQDYQGDLLSWRDPEDPRHQEAREVLGPDFDPRAFNIDEINHRLAEFGSFSRQPELWRQKPSEVLGSGRPPRGGRWVYGARSRKR
jgi:hypothetical protein